MLSRGGHTEGTIASAPTTLAAAPKGQIIYVGNEDVTNGGYWTTDSDGNVTAYTGEGTPSDNYIHYDTDTNTLTLHNVTIKTSNAHMNLSGSAIGVLNGSGDAELTIQLEGDNTIENVSRGIRVFSESSGTANLTITGEGSLDASGSQYGISIQSNDGDVALSIQTADVTTTATGIAIPAGVYLHADVNCDASLSVEGGSLTATVSAADATYHEGIRFIFGGGFTDPGTPRLTISNHAIVWANGGISENSNKSDLEVGADSTKTNGGIVFNGDEGTVYGNVTLQEDLTISEGESLDIPNDAA